MRNFKFVEVGDFGFPNYRLYGDLERRIIGKTVNQLSGANMDVDDVKSLNTIYYSLKLKKSRTPIELFEKLTKSFKKKGATKKWKYTISDNSISIDFCDDRSETLYLEFDKAKACDGFCKVCFPLEGDCFDDEKKSEFKALLNMLWSARNMFSKMDVSDDYGLSTDFFESKKYKLSLCELTEEEYSNIKKICDSGKTSYSDVILAIVCNELGMAEGEKWYDHINEKIPFAYDHLTSMYSEMWGFWETYIFETAEYKNERVMYEPSYYIEFSGCWSSVAAFTLAIDELYYYKNYWNHDSNNSFGVKHAQIRRFYKDKIYPKLLSMSDGFEKCCLAYQYFLTVYKFCGFKYLGKEKDTANYKYIKVSIEELPDGIKG